MPNERKNSDMSNFIPFPNRHSLAAAPPEADAPGFGSPLTPEERAAARAYEDTLSELARKLQEETKREIARDRQNSLSPKRAPDHPNWNIYSGKDVIQ